MATAIIYSEKANLAAELMTAAGEAGLEAKAVAFNDSELANDVAARGVDVVLVKDDAIALGDTAAVAQAVAQVADSADVVLLASNRRGKELAGRVAQILGAGCLTDVNALALDGAEIVASRNALGGATVAEQVIKTDKKVYAISPKSFAAAEKGVAGSVESTAVDVTPSVTVVETKPKSVESVDITAAETLVCIGQGADSEDQVGQAAELAKALGGELACSKPLATDRKWLSEERIVGISGSLCKPDLAITLGISGQVQFTVGIRDAKTVVAVDTDENAPIFQVADYCLVEDLSTVIPELAKAI